jgi:hypothetical protein
MGNGTDNRTGVAGPWATYNSNTISGSKVMSYITQQISEKKQLVAEIIEDAIFSFSSATILKLPITMNTKSEGEERTKFPMISCTHFLWVLMIPHEFGRATCPLVSVFPNKIIYSNYHSLEHFPS